MTEQNSRQNTTFTGGEAQAHGYLAVPSSGSGPGVILVQEWWGAPCCSCGKRSV